MKTKSVADVCTQHHGGAKAEFCASFPWGSFALQWFDLSGIHTFAGVGEHRIAKVTLAERGCHNSYVGFHVEIIHPSNGVVDSKFFEFNDYLSTDPSNLRDIRNDGRGDKSPLTFYGFSCSAGHKGCCWYLAEPIDKTPIARAIEAYVRRFK